MGGRIVSLHDSFSAEMMMMRSGCISSATMTSFDAATSDHAGNKKDDIT